MLVTDWLFIAAILSAIAISAKPRSFKRDSIADNRTIGAKTIFGAMGLSLSFDTSQEFDSTMPRTERFSPASKENN